MLLVLGEAEEEDFQVFCRVIGGLCRGEFLDMVAKVEASQGSVEGGRCGWKGAGGPGIFAFGEGGGIAEEEGIYSLDEEGLCFGFHGGFPYRLINSMISSREINWCRGRVQWEFGLGWC